MAGRKTELIIGGENSLNGLPGKFCNLKDDNIKNMVLLVVKKKMVLHRWRLRMYEPEDWTPRWSLIMAKLQKTLNNLNQMNLTYVWHTHTMGVVWPVHNLQQMTSNTDSEISKILTKANYTGEMLKRFLAYTFDDWSQEVCFRNYWAEGKYDKVQIHGPHHPTNSLSSLPLLDQFSKVNRIAYI